MLAVSSALAVLLTQAAQTSPAPGRLAERLTCPSDPTQTYTLYLPSGYTAERTWPLLFVFDPRGRGRMAAEVFREAAETFGWIIVSSDNTQSDGEWEPNRRALVALWPDVVNLYSVDHDRIYAAGFSGGATVALVLARSSGRIAGIVATGAPAPQESTVKPSDPPWFGAAGRFDFNFLPARILDARMAQAGVLHRLEFFDGVHQWMPPELAVRAAGWLEMVAMKRGTRPRDEAIAAGILGREMASVDRLISEGRLVDARRTLGTVVETFDGIADAAPAAKRARELDADERLARARKNEERLDERTNSQYRAAAAVLARLYGPDAPFARELIRELKIAQLKDTAARDGYEGEAAQRVLENIFVQMSFYVPRELEEKQQFARAAAALEIAAAIHDDRASVWVNLAAARAMAGFKKPAIEALEKAVAAGLKDRQAIENAKAFDSLRAMPEYKRLLDSLRGT